MFEDFNECSLDPSTCSTNANCSNTLGSFACTCLEGFTGNGILCEGMYPYNEYTLGELMKASVVKNGKFGVRFTGRLNRTQIANGSPLMRCFFGAVLPNSQALSHGDGARHLLHAYA